jgi:putative transposase
LLGYSRQVYYRAKRRRIKWQELAKKVLVLVDTIRLQMPRLGAKKLYHLLHAPLRALGVGRDKLLQILRANHLLIKPKRSYHITTNSHHRFRKHKNLIENQTPQRPEEIWVSDITYVGNRKNPLYLALVTDAYSKKIMGYDLSESLATQGVIHALKMAYKQRAYPDKKLIHHSDRGLQYCSDEYQELLKDFKLTCSMTESYDPYANAVAERINGILKQEFIGYKNTNPIKVMKKLIQNSISIYNNYRPHYSCLMNTPAQMHKQCKIKIRTYRKKRSSQLVLTASP